MDAVRNGVRTLTHPLQDDTFHREYNNIYNNKYKYNNYTHDIFPMDFHPIIAIHSVLFVIITNLKIINKNY